MKKMNCHSLHDQFCHIVYDDDVKRNVRAKNKGKTNAWRRLSFLISCVIFCQCNNFNFYRDTTILLNVLCDKMEISDSFKSVNTTYVWMPMFFANRSNPVIKL
jgi:hypothetical protein